MTDEDIRRAEALNERAQKASVIQDRWERAQREIGATIEHEGPIQVVEYIRKGRAAVRGAVTKLDVEAPWADKTTLACQTCQYYSAQHEEAAGVDAAGMLRYKGRCRRHAPTLTGYPVVFPLDWCGDHKLGTPPR